MNLRFDGPNDGGGDLSAEPNGVKIANGSSARITTTLADECAADFQPSSFMTDP